jgi:hypothetical protein
VRSPFVLSEPKTDDAVAGADRGQQRGNQTHRERPRFADARDDRNHRISRENESDQDSQKPLLIPRSPVRVQPGPIQKPPSATHPNPAPASWHHPPAHDSADHQQNSSTREDRQRVRAGGWLLVRLAVRRGTADERHVGGSAARLPAARASTHQRVCGTRSKTRVTVWR